MRGPARRPGLATFLAGGALAGAALAGAILAGVGATPATVARTGTGVEGAGPGGERAGPAPGLLPSLSAADPGEGPAYDGRFTFVRIRFEAGGRDLRNFGFRRGGREPLWAHDYPRAERNFTRILDATTLIRPHVDESGGRILALDDPELFRHPIAYIVEVGYWQPTASERRALREYLLKGGFLIVDDFRGGDMRNFQAVMAQVLPGVRMIPLGAGHGVFDSFFHIEDPSALAPPTYPQYPPVYLGMFEGDDPSGRLMVMINYNNDIAEYWEYSDQGFLPIDLTNEAYKFGVNYIIYGMTH